MRLNQQIITEVGSDSRQLVVNVWVEGLAVDVVEWGDSVNGRSRGSRRLACH